MTLEKLKNAVPKDFALDIDFIDEIVKKLVLNKDASILDVGTGFGIMAIILALNGYDVVTGKPKVNPESHEHHGQQDYHHEQYNYNFEQNTRMAGVKNKIKFQQHSVIWQKCHYILSPFIFVCICMHVSTKTCKNPRTTNYIST